MKQVGIPSWRVTDQEAGIKIVVRAVEEPLRQTVYNSANGEYGDLVEMGVVDPTKVTRMALQNAASIAGLMLTTEAMVAEALEDKPAGGGGMGGMDMLDGGVVVERYEGTPQGGPLSPLLANVQLDEVDRELGKRGHRFVRYADDTNVYVRSHRADERVLAGLRQIYARLHLKLNEAKTAVASALGRKFLGFAFWKQSPEVKCRVADKPLATFKQRIRWMTRRSSGRSLQEVADRLRQYIPGWKGYFQLAQTPGVFRSLDGWIRHRLRALQLKHWKRGKTMYRELLALGASPTDARKLAANSRCWWRNSRHALNRAMPIAYFDRLGVPRLS